ncbi:KRAB domain-containing zinc finger protein [Sarotherodon galilaeus]
MELKKRVNSGDQYAWICREAAHGGHVKQTFIRHKSFSAVLKFSQGLQLRQIDMIDDTIAGSTTTLSKMSKKIRRVCVAAGQRLRRRTGQQIGGRREFVVIDESHFRHKRQYLLVIFVHFFVSASVGERKNGWGMEKKKVGLWNAGHKTSRENKTYLATSGEKISKTSCSCDYPSCPDWFLSDK